MLHADLKCLRVEYKSEIMFEIGIDELMPITCDTDKEIDSLNCSNSYNISVYWISSISASQTCFMAEVDHLMPLCPPITSKPGNSIKFNLFQIHYTVF